MADPVRRRRLGAPTCGGLLAGGLVLGGAMLVPALLAPALPGFGPDEPDFAALLQPPGWVHPFGTDDLGRDMLARCLWSVRTAGWTVLLSVPAAALLGSGAGMLAAAAGGRLETLILRLADGLLAIPAVLLAISIAGVLGGGPGSVALAIAIVATPVFIRLARAGTRTCLRQGFVLALKAIGASPARILASLLPHLAATLMVQASLSASDAVLTEAYLDFLGLGIPPPTATLGGMIHEGLALLDPAPWLVFAPGFVLLCAAGCLALISDGLVE